MQRRWRDPCDVLARLKPLIIDEFDGELASFPRRPALGYTGVSSKNCKGFYKSILNAARIAKLNAEAGSARLLHVGRGPHHAGRRQRAARPGSGSAAGAGHVERNGHHFIDGMSFAPPSASRRTLPAPIPIFTSDKNGPARLRIHGGAADAGSLACPGFAVAAAMDFAAMRPMPAAPPGAHHARAPGESMMSRSDAAPARALRNPLPSSRIS